ALGIKISFEGEGLDEVGRDETGKVIVSVDPRYFRPTEVETLLGDATKAREKLGWTPPTSFEDLVSEMIAADYADAKRNG
ncbi:MAG: GDP-mannose 4,6-dehydratase, partial [Litoreibacter sp.]|nr:GDP-mannose 4,6-dehydratase [Litoreibacter sp.]